MTIHCVHVQSTTIVIPRDKSSYHFIRCRATYVPHIIIAVTIITLIVTYSLDFAYRHQDRPFPMISETGETRPERFVFTFSFCVFGGVMIAMTTLMIGDETMFQQKELENEYEYHIVGFYRVLPWINMSIGLLMAIGIALVGLIPDDTVQWLHFTGATIAFVCVALWTLGTGLAIRHLDLTAARLSGCEKCFKYEFSPCNVFVRRIIYGLVSVTAVILLLIFRVIVTTDATANNYFLTIFELANLASLLIFLATLRNFIRTYACVRGTDEQLFLIE